MAVSTPQTRQILVIPLITCQGPSLFWSCRIEFRLWFPLLIQIRGPGFLPIHTHFGTGAAGYKGQGRVWIVCLQKTRTPRSPLKPITPRPRSVLKATGTQRFARPGDFDSFLLLEENV